MEMDTGMTYDEYEKGMLTHCEEIFSQWDKLTKTEKSFHVLSNSEFYKKIQQAKYFMYIQELEG